MLDRDDIARRYGAVRARTEALAAPLSAEDALVQSMPDASPTKWHLAHTTWFFEEFVLARFEPSHRWRDERWRMLFNSYYESVGPRHPRPERGLLSRPALDEVRGWRGTVDERVLALIAGAASRARPEILEAVLLGTHHEEQHQELLLTDALHALSRNPLGPRYLPPDPPSPAPAFAPALAWRAFDESLAEIGHAGSSFAFDHETPRHRVFVGAFELASRLVTHREYAAFVEDGGYARPELWLADGWAAARAGGWSAPLYWTGHAGRWFAFGLHGHESLDLDAPVAHLSFYEADAYARWAGTRLPTEFEWELAARTADLEGNFLESGRLRTAPASAGPGLVQLFGDAWEWTSSPYLPYPRFQPHAGALGEYNGKFMSGQMVLRGGSCLSPAGHLRRTYRNFFPPHARWQMAGLRLARDPDGA
ncbi:MAG: ergothioneine biosynthesis protein EgtB [Myxococcales bacterium]|nr:ergothioneine biosynthesis protein EgtB [Myxococcales bacterium]